MHLDATEHGETLVFLHTVKEGRPTRATAWPVAQLAGVPSEVIVRAREHLSRLEDTALPHEAPKPAIKGKPAAPQQSDMFASLPHPVLDELAKVDLDDLTPRRALELLYALKNRSKHRRTGYNANGFKLLESRAVWDAAG